MIPSELRAEIVQLVVSFGAATQTGNKLVIDATGQVINLKLLELIPDPVKEPQETSSNKEAELQRPVE